MVEMHFSSDAYYPSVVS